MRRDPTKFRERFNAWKNGELVYLGGRPTELPDYEGGKDDDITTLREITVTPNESYAMASSDDMRRDLHYNIARAKYKNNLDAYNLQRNMNAAQEGVAMNVGLPLVSGLAGGPISNLAFTFAGMGAHDLGERLGGLKGAALADAAMLLPMAYHPARAVASATRDAALLGAYNLSINAAKKIGGNRLATAIYNNVMPGSYYDSYIPSGTKATEVKNAFKDFFNPRVKLELNPKWKSSQEAQKMFDSFGTKVSGMDVRDEIYRKHMGLGSQDKYYVPTGRVDKNGNPIYSYAVDFDNRQIPIEDMQRQVDYIYRMDEDLSGNRIVDADRLGTAGGNAGHRLINSDAHYATYKYDDVWDVNPFYDANRAKILPKWILDKYTHFETAPRTKKYPDFYRRRVWNEDVPKWVRKLLNFELSDLTPNGHPITVETEFPVAKLTKNKAFKTKVYTDDEIIDRLIQSDPLIDLEMEHLDLLSPEDGKIAFNLIILRAENRARGNFHLDPKKFRRTYGLGRELIPIPQQTLWETYGTPTITLSGFNDYLGGFKFGKDAFKK